MLHWLRIGRTSAALLACGTAFAQADSAIVQEMRNTSRGLQNVRIMHRSPADADLDIVVALGGPRSWQPDAAKGSWWGGGSVLGIFVQRRNNPGLLYKIVVDGGDPTGDCYATVERATANDVVVACVQEKSRNADSRKFVYDIRAKALVKPIQYNRFASHRLFVSGDKAYLVMSNHNGLAALEYRAGSEPVFRLLRGPEAERWTKRLRVTEFTVGSGKTERSELVVEPQKFRPVRFGPDNRFELLTDATLKPSVGDRTLVVVEGMGAKAKRFVLAQTAVGMERNEEIGPWQINDDTLWFAKTFYAGEGMTGIGGFGYFDTAKHEYRIFSPEEIKRSSASAMLVESDAVWLGLEHRGEYGSSSNGVLRFDRKSHDVTRIPLHEIVTNIGRVGDAIVMGTDFGAAVYDGRTLRRFLIDETTDGRLRVVEGLPVTP